MLLEAMETAFYPCENASQTGDARMAGIHEGKHTQGLLADKS